MIYIISGASRSGKTIAAKEILNEYKIPYLSTDYLMMGFMQGVPEMEIHDKLWPNEIAKKMWRFLEPFIETMIHNDIDYLLEGEAFLPELLSPLIKKYPNRIKVCFLGYKDVSLYNKVADVLKHAHKNDWLVDLGIEEINDHIQNMIGYSKYIYDESNKYQMQYFDTSNDFLKGIEKSIQFIITKS